MEWQAKWEDPLQSYLQGFDGLLGDARTRGMFRESVRGKGKLVTKAVWLVQMVVLGT